MAFPVESADRFYVRSSWALLAILVALVGICLALPLLMPLGAMTWDTYLYLDAAHRIATGQLPAVDFFIPVGPLGYYLVYILQLAFPQAQPILLSSWAMLLVTVPVMALVTAEVARRSPVAAICLVAPFVAYSFLPFNTSEYYVFPGSDGFGIYNRHSSQLLFVLTAALLFVRDQRVMAIAVGVLMFAMFGIKITAFIAGGLLCAYALLAGRVTLPAAAAAAVGAIVAVGIVELATGMISAYVHDIIVLVTMNSGVLASRMLQSASRTAGTTLSTILLIAFFLWIAARHRFASDVSNGFGVLARIRAVADQPAGWLAVALFAGVFFESQNTGGQELIQLWPVVLYALIAIQPLALPAGFLAAIYFTAAAAVASPLVQTAHHAARAIGTMAKQVPLKFENLKTMNAATTRLRAIERAGRMELHYIEHADALRDLANRGEMGSFLLFSDMDFQYGLLENMDEVVARLNQLEQDGWRYETIMTLDFTNPFPWLLDKTAPKHIAIGADPTRAVPPLTDAVADAVRAADIVLEPQCPYTDATRMLLEVYRPALAKHRYVEITPCYNAWILDGVDG